MADCFVNANHEMFVVPTEEEGPVKGPAVCSKSDAASLLLASNVKKPNRMEPASFFPLAGSAQDMEELRKVGGDGAAVADMGVLWSYGDASPIREKLLQHGFSANKNGSAVGSAGGASNSSAAQSVRGQARVSGSSNASAVGVGVSGAKATAADLLRLAGSPKTEKQASPYAPSKVGGKSKKETVVELAVVYITLESGKVLYFFVSICNIYGLFQWCKANMAFCDEMIAIADMKMMFPQRRAVLLEQSGVAPAVESMPHLAHNTPAWIYVASSTNMDVLQETSNLIEELIAQFERLIPGAADESNHCTFALKVVKIEATCLMVTAAMALRRGWM